MTGLTEQLRGGVSDDAAHPTSARLRGSDELHPYVQGDLDGLCGIYAAVNGLQLVLAPLAPLSEAQCAGLFKHAGEVLLGDNGLHLALSWGISSGRWRRLVAELCRSASRRQRVHARCLRPFPGTVRVSRFIVMRSIERAVVRGSPVLLALRGAYNHYTVIVGYTPKRLLLHDSWGYRWVERASCSVSREPPIRRHHIPLSSVLFLEVAP